MSKKLLLLGGSAQQVVAIKRAKELGYTTILCDYLPDNPGQHEADRFYQISTTDKEAVMQVAVSESIDGIVAYSSDPAAPTAAFIAEKLGLPGIPFKTAETFCNKKLFRLFLEQNGFAVPWSMTVDSAQSLCDEAITDDMLPCVVKPVDSSGSKGVTVVRSLAELSEAVSRALSFSKSSTVLIEQFLVRDHRNVIEAEIFVLDGCVASWGIINSVRDTSTNPLLPAGYSYPSDLPDGRLELVQKEVSRLIQCGNILSGALNLEMIITSNEDLFFLDVGPRNGGNMLPEFIGAIAGADYAKATVAAAMGDEIDEDAISLMPRNGRAWGLAVLHSDRDGAFQKVEYSAAAKSALRREFLYKEAGDSVNRFVTCNDAVGLAFFEFEDEVECHGVMNSMLENIKVIVA